MLLKERWCKTYNLLKTSYTFILSWWRYKTLQLTCSKEKCVVRNLNFSDIKKINNFSQTESMGDFHSWFGVCVVYYSLRRILIFHRFERISRQLKSVCCESFYKLCKTFIREVSMLDMLVNCSAYFRIKVWTPITRNISFFAQSTRKPKLFRIIFFSWTKINLKKRVWWIYKNLPTKTQSFTSFWRLHLGASHSKMRVFPLIWYSKPKTCKFTQNLHSCANLTF